MRFGKILPLVVSALACVTVLAVFSSSADAATAPAASRVGPTRSAEVAEAGLTAKRPSGMPWASGAFMPAMTAAAQTQFGKWRGATSDVAMVYTLQDTWAEIVNPTDFFADWKSAPETVVLSSAPYPNGQGSLAACAKGSYDAQWRKFGANVAASGMSKRIVIRLAYEFNGSWAPWAATSPSHYISCWRHIVTAARSKAPRLRWDWTVNRGRADALADPTKAWPGKKYVDYVGIDSYDGYPAVTSASGWKVQYSGPQGLKYWADFAKKKGVRFSVPEWGLYPGTAWAGHNGGDNPYYIAKMFGFFTSLGSRLGFETYFNDTDPAQGGALTLNPGGGAEYKKLVKLARAAG